MTLIQTPASDSLHRASAAPAMAGSFASIRCSITAVPWYRSNSPGSRPHSRKS